jgi:hypothetical protein
METGSKTLRLVFLDADGVINNSASLLEARKQVFGDKLRAVKESDAKELAQASIDPKAVANLNDLLERSGAKVVISSTWRLYWSVDEIKELLVKKGFAGKIIGVTPEITRGRPEAQRAFEISDWLAHFEKLETVDSLVILDDYEVGCGWNPWQVLTDRFNGLTKENVETALKILEMEW